jgi:hypothetical protein
LNEKRSLSPALFGYCRVERKRIAGRAGSPDPCDRLPDVLWKDSLSEFALRTNSLTVLTAASPVRSRKPFTIRNEVMALQRGRARWGALRPALLAERGCDHLVEHELRWG